jgi:hypothetical protein
MGGLGDAILYAREHVGDEPFAVLLGDTVVASHTDKPVTRQLADVVEAHGGSAVALQRVSPDKVSRYGILGEQLIEVPHSEKQECLPCFLLQSNELLHEGSGALGRVGIEPVSHGSRILAESHNAMQQKPLWKDVFEDQVCYPFAFDFNMLGTDFTADFSGEVQWIQLRIKKFW